MSDIANFNDIDWEAELDEADRATDLDELAKGKWYLAACGIAAFLVTLWALYATPG